MADRLPELLIDRHFFDLSETCLYMVHFGLEIFFWEIARRLSTKPREILIRATLFSPKRYPSETKF